MTTDAVVTAEPPKELRFRRSNRLGAVLREIWQSRPLVRALAERSIRAQYKQAGLGVAWAVVTPVILMLVFTLLIKNAASIHTGDVPPAIFSYVALVPWNFFSSSVTSGGLSIINQMALVNKIRCAREVFPLAEVATSAFSAVIAASVLLVLFVIYQFAPKLDTLWAPVALVVQVTFTVGVVFLTAGITVYLRDLRHALPILMQIGLLATPIFYNIDQVPKEWQTLYVVVNPMAAVITTYRDTILFGIGVPWHLLLPAAASSVVWLYCGLRLFRRLELGFADVA